MKIGEKLDTGPICNSYKIKITELDNAEIISEKLSLFAAEKILDNIDNILENKFEVCDLIKDLSTSYETLVGKNS